MYNIREVQLVQLDILKQVIALCEKHNIKYYAVYGTLLGAVRHKGFIPWDDDIDIAMLRPDFDRFCEIAEKELPKPYFLQTHKTDPEYYLHIARVQNLDTTLVEQAYSHLNIKFGICVDIYPLDGVSNDASVEKQIEKFRFYRRWYGLCMTSWIDARKCWKKYVKLLLGKVINLFCYGYKPVQFFYDKMEELYRTTSYETAREYVADWHTFDININIAVYKKEIFATTRKAMFEDIEIAIPGKAEELLEYMYGDFMRLPPEEKRVAHHGYVAIDTKTAYIEYIKNKGVVQQ